MDDINYLKRKIKEIIKESPVPEDLVHSKNTLEWLLKLNPDADEALQIAALGHDIERAIEGRKVKREDYKNYNEFKDAHALNSAKVMTEIMKECNMSKRLADDIFSLVRYHETGNTKRSDILRDADSISFFHVNLPYYFIRNGAEETKKRCSWGYRRISEHLQPIVAELVYRNKELEALVRTCISESE
ncbi:MAG: DUF4202 domain-containing protein [Omnitrophica bacterium]|nr:DUF4202 domain-containing protein [Candidatus Omnitrophota bacterium]